MNKRRINASVKDEKLIKLRREQIIKGAVPLIIEKGFHRSTTREMAKAAGFSIGTLYEYINEKEDVLYLVCDRIYDEVRDKLLVHMDSNNWTINSLKASIANFFRIMDEMQSEVLVLYQEVRALSKDALPYVLRKELEMVAMFEQILEKCVENHELKLTKEEIQLISHNIFVQGQMWGFRRWALHKMFTLDEYIELQTKCLLSGICINAKTQP